MLNCIKLSAITFDCATATPLKVLIYMEIFPVNISAWKIHKLILSDTVKNSTDFEKKKKDRKKLNFL